MDNIRKIRGETALGKKPDSAIITKADLDRIRNATVITTKEEKKGQHNLMKEQEYQSQAAARARKERMAKFDVQRQHMLPPDQSQREHQEVTDNLLTRA